MEPFNLQLELTDRLLKFSAKHLADLTGFMISSGGLNIPLVRNAEIQILV
jgi:hypothetical protein